MVVVRRGIEGSDEPVRGPQYDEQGWWWALPAGTPTPPPGEPMPAPDDAMPGRLQVDKDGNARLELFGARADPFGGPPRDVAAIVGHTVSGRLVSVLEPWQATMTATLGASSEELWFSDLVLVGAHAAAEADVLLESATIEVHGLREWLGDWWGGEHEAFPLRARETGRYLSPADRRRRRFGRPRRRAAGRGRSPRRARAVQRTRELRRRLLWEVDRHRTVEASVGEAMISLEIREHGHTSRWTERTEKRAHGFLKFVRPVTLVELERDWLTPITDMVAFMTARPSVVTKLLVAVEQPADAFLRPVLRAPWTHETAVLRRRDEPGPVPTLNGTLPLPASAARSEGSELLRRWFEEHRKIGRAGRLIFGTLQGRDQWPENELLSRVSFAEAYHERFFDYPAFDEDLNKELMKEALEALPDEAKQPWRDKLTWATRLTQRTRLAELVDLAAFSVPQLEPHAETLVSQLTQTRNYRTHWGKRGSHVVEGRDLLLAVERLLIVLRTVILWHMGVDEMCIQRAMLRGDHRFGALRAPEPSSRPRA